MAKSRSEPKSEQLANVPIVHMMEKDIIINTDGSLEIPRDLDPEVNKEILDICKDLVADDELAKLTSFLEGGAESICLFGDKKPDIPNKKINWE